MASPLVRRSNDSPAKHPRSNARTSGRRILVDVSPNIKAASLATTSLLNSKPMTGSPLKRSFTAAMEDAEGFTYLKKRKLSGDQALSEVDGVVDVYESQFQPLLQAMQDEEDQVYPPQLPLLITL